MVLYYTAHHNWSWVLDAAIASLGSDSVKVPRMHQLPSQHHNKTPRSYALFRVEVANKSDISSIVWCTSTALAFLDPKDSFATASARGKTMVKHALESKKIPSGATHILTYAKNKWGENSNEVCCELNALCDGHVR